MLYCKECGYVWEQEAEPRPQEWMDTCPRCLGIRIADATEDREER